MSRKVKVSSFEVTAQNTRAEVLRTPAPEVARPVFGYAWEALVGEIETHITLRDHARQAQEDERAVRRNRNRMLTLLGALLIGLVVTYCLSHGIPSARIGKTYGPYSFVITVALDSMLAVYSWIRRY